MSGIDALAARNGAYGSLPQDSYKSDSGGDLPPWFNGDIPNDYNNFYGDPNDSIEGKLRHMIQYMRAHPGNLAAQQKFLEYVANLAKAGEFTSHPQLLKMIQDVSVGGKSIVEEAIDILIEKGFYDGGGEDGMKDEIQKLRQMFAGAGEPFSTEVGHALDDWERRMPDFVKKNTDPDTGKPYLTDPDLYNAVLSGIWGNFLEGFDHNSWEKDTRMSMYNEIIKECQNPLVAAMILLAMLSESDDANDISGLGDTSGWLSDKSNDISDILSGFKHFDSPEDAKKWIDEINKLLFEADHDPRAGGLKELLDSNLGDGILNTPTTYKDADGNPLTINQLANGYDDSTGHHGPQLDKLQKSLNSMMPGSDPSQPVPSQYQTILNHLNSAGAAVSDQSQTVTTQVGQISKMMQAMENFLNKVLNDNSSGQAGLVNNAVSNQKA